MKRGSGELMQPPARPPTSISSAHLSVLLMDAPPQSGESGPLERSGESVSGAQAGRTCRFCIWASVCVCVCVPPFTPEPRRLLTRKHLNQLGNANRT